MTSSIPLPPEWRHNKLKVLLAGCGGNGSHMLTHLARMHSCMVALGHPGILLTAVDPDVVTEFNLGRQAFCAADVGLPKATVLVNRMNTFYGTGWQAEQAKLTSNSQHYCDIVITCVDNLAARRTAWNWVKRANVWWMDLGNDAAHGQVILGLSENMAFGRKEPRGKTTIDGQSVERPPHFFDLHPELLTSKRKEAGPSCSVAEALARQDLFINSTLANFAAHLLWRWFRQGALEHHGYFVNLSTGRVTPLPVTSKTK